MPSQHLIAVGAYFPDDSLDFQESVIADLERIEVALKPFNYLPSLVELSHNPQSDPLFRGLSRWFAEADPNQTGRVIFYFSGHGHVGNDGGHYLLLSDSQLLQLDATALRVDALCRAMVDPSRVRRLVLILDACYAGNALTNLAELSNRLQTFQHGITIWLIAATRVKEEADKAAFSMAFSHVLANVNQKLGGTTQRDIYLEPLLSEVNRLLTEQGLRQRATGTIIPYSTGEGIFPNPAYDERVPVDRDLETQRDLKEHWLPRAQGVEISGDAWYFSGRTKALRQIVSWFNQPTSSRKAYVITGGPGSGKSAVLARIVTLSNQQCRLELNHLGLLTNIPADVVAPEGIVDLAIHARRKSLRDVLIQTARSLREADLLRQLETAIRPEEIVSVAAKVVDALRIQPKYCIVLDALDESVEAHELLQHFVLPITRIPQVWILVGSRPDTPWPAERRVKALKHAGVEIDLDSASHLGETDIEDYVTSRLLAGPEPHVSTPYRGRPELAQKVGRAVAQKSKRTFLLARILSRTLRDSRDVPEVSNDKWQDSLPVDVGEAFEHDLERFDGMGIPGVTKTRLIELLTPLAFGRGRGVPREGIWESIVEHMTRRSIDERGLHLMGSYVGAYIVEDNEDGRSVYRLFHEALAEFLKGRWRHNARAERRIVDALIYETPDRESGGKDWPRAHPYVLKYLASHAAAAGRLSECISDLMFMITADPEWLIPEIQRATGLDGEALETAKCYLRAVHWFVGASPPERASYLQLSACFMRNGALIRRIASLGVVQRWEARWAHWQTECPHRILRVPGAPVSRVAIGYVKGQMVMVSGDQEGRVSLWDVPKGEPIRVLRPRHRCAVISVAVGHCKNRTVLASAGENGMVHLWYSDVIPPFAYLLWKGVMSLAVGSRDGRTVVAIGRNFGGITLWDPESSRTEALDAPECAQGSVNAVAIEKWSNKSVLLAFYGYAMTVVMYDLDSKEVLFQWKLPSSESFGPTAAVGMWHGRPILASSGQGLRFWDLIGRKFLGTPLQGLPKKSTFRERISQSDALAVGSWGGRLVLISTDEGCILRVWDPDRSQDEKRTGVKSFYSHFRLLTGLAVGVWKGQILAMTGGQDGVVRLWDAVSGRAWGSPLRGNWGGVNAVASFSRFDRTFVVSGGGDGVLRSWDVATARPEGDPLNIHEGAINAVAAAGNGSRSQLISGGQDGTVRLWDVDTMVPQHLLTAVPSSPITAV